MPAPGGETVSRARTSRDRGGQSTVPLCDHLKDVPDAAPRPETPDGCAECLASGGRWVHLRLCEACGHVGCCDSSPGRHATAHFHAIR